jgi:hypothetical protein
MRVSSGMIAAFFAVPWVHWAAHGQDLNRYCAQAAGQTLGMKQGKPVPITCDAVHTMADWFPVPALGQGYVQALKSLSRAKFSTFYDDPKDPSLRLVCKPNLQGYLCELPLGPAELLVDNTGTVHAISKVISKDGPDYAAVMAKAAGELGVDTLTDTAMTLAMDIEADAMKQGAGNNVEVTKTNRSYVYLFHL